MASIFKRRGFNLIDCKNGLYFIEVIIKKRSKNLYLSNIEQSNEEYMKTFLVVDDSMMTRLMVKTIVAEHHPDWKILQAKDADDALEQVADIDFDIATVDMNMPGKTGLELIPILQESHPDAKIALLTANIQKRIIDKAEELGIQVIGKPVNEDAILKYLEA